MAFFNIVWPPLPSGPNKQRKGYIEVMEMMKAIKTGRKMGENVKMEEWTKFSNNFENDFMKPPSPVCPENYKAKCVYDDAYVTKDSCERFHLLPKFHWDKWKSCNSEVKPVASLILLWFWQKWNGKTVILIFSASFSIKISLVVLDILCAQRRKDTGDFRIGTRKDAVINGSQSLRHGVSSATEWKRRPPDIGRSCEKDEEGGVDSRQGAIFVKMHMYLKSLSYLNIK